MRVYLDFETASYLDLAVVGLDNYLKHHTTKALLAVVAWENNTGVWCGDDFPVGVDLPGEYLSTDKLQALLESADTVVCHNAGFDLAVYRQLLKCEMPLSKVSCTMARSAAEGLPLGLGQVAMALNLVNKKASAKVMKQAAQLTAQGELQVTVTQLLELAEYCVQDIKVTRELDGRLPELSSRERQVWELDQTINRRGVLLDRRLAEKLKELLLAAEWELLRDFAKATGGKVLSPRQTAAFKNWLADNGVHVDSVAKDILDNLDLSSAPENVVKAIEIRRSLRKSSTAKLETMLQTASTSNNRVRGMFQYHGASTGRFSGRGVQPHNLPRANVGEWYEEAACAAEADPTGAALELVAGPIFEAVSKMLRGLFVAAPRNTFIVGDFAQIEARVLPWLAGQENTLEAFRNGVEIYKVAASGIYHKSMDAVTKDERQVGKVAILACGYQGGWRAFEKMGKNYDVHVPEDQAREIVNAWREANPAIVIFWGALQSAAITAVRNPGETCTVGRLAFSVKKNRLLMRLPSGRHIVYQDPKMVRDDFGQKLEYSAMDQGKYSRWPLYGGLLAENATQAVARDILTEAMLRVEERGLCTVLHVHDEIVVEVPNIYPPVKAFEACMEVVPYWAKGCPIKVEAWAGERYKK